MNCMEQKLRQELKEILEKYTKEKDNLIPILNDVQVKYGYIPQIAQSEISEYLSIPMAEIYGVITFYSRFTLKPKGKYAISVCLGTACFVKGSEKLMNRLKERLGIKEGETTEDGKFSIDSTHGLLHYAWDKDSIQRHQTPTVHWYWPHTSSHFHVGVTPNSDYRLYKHGVYSLLSAVANRHSMMSTIREEKRRELNIRVDTTVGEKEKHILVCHGTGCTSSKSTQVIENFRRLVKEKKLENVRVIQTGCFGLCAKGPIVIIRPEDTFYAMVKPEDCEEIIQKHIIDGEIVERLLCKDIDGTKVNKLDDLTFYKKQKRIALQNSGKIDPENIDEYIAFDGYKALEKVLLKMTPDEVIKTIEDSGLRGRGGAGFPTGRKWALTKAVESEQKYVVCNADEGDPGAFMDRSILEGDPHSVLEAMMVAGYAIGANQGYIYVRAEYPIAVDRLKVAIMQAKEYGILGKNIFGTNFNFDIDVRLGAGAFVCGEETALLESIEGKRGHPRLKPPYPANSGLWGKPTLINNVETYANVTRIILNGAKWYSSIGTETSKGTKVFALGGNVENIGLVEVPMGTTLREIVYDIGGGIPNNREFKAAQTGGPSGGCIPKEHLDTPIDYESLKQIGSMMGSGGLIVMDDTKCMVNIAKFYLEFTVDESCGKCTPCRIGTKRMLEILEKITNGEATKQDLEKLEELANIIPKTSVCGLGQSAPNPVLSTLKYFREEYVEHIEEKKCRTGECKALAKIQINPDKCRGCTKCSRNCPVQAITGEPGKTHHIDEEKCIKCGTCLNICPFHAIG